MNYAVVDPTWMKLRSTSSDANGCVYVSEIVSRRQTSGACRPWLRSTRPLSAPLALLSFISRLLPHPVCFLSSPSDRYRLLKISLQFLSDLRRANITLSHVAIIKIKLITRFVATICELPLQHTQLWNYRFF